MSATMRLRNALAWSGSAGGASVTVGLSSAGPPPVLDTGRPGMAVAAHEILPQ